jgi:hypothetical protein
MARQHRVKGDTLWKEYVRKRNIAKNLSHKKHDHFEITKLDPALPPKLLFQNHAKSWFDM